MKSVDELTDAEVLKLSGNGLYGPGIIGQELYDRAKSIMRHTAGGMFGPALTDPDYAAKLAGRRALDQEAATEKALLDGTLPDVPRRVDDDSPINPADLADPRNPWTYVTLSGAKMLAQDHGVSYLPRIKRAELIAELQNANVVPPAIELDEPDAQAAS